MIDYRLIILVGGTAVWLGCKEPVPCRDDSHEAQIILQESLRLRWGNGADPTVSKVIKSGVNVHMSINRPYDRYEWRTSLSGSSDIFSTDAAWVTSFVATNSFNQNLALSVEVERDLPEDCKENVLLGLVTDTFRITSLFQQESLVLGIFEGANEDEPLKRLRVELREEPPVAPGYGSYISFSGLPETCTERLTQLQVGYEHFSILHGETTAFGCMGIQGLGKAFAGGDSLWIVYEVLDLSGAARIRHRFRGKRV